MIARATLILAAGESRRWAGRPKHLVRLWDGETVLSRMVRQVRMHGIEPIIVARDPEILQAARDVPTLTFARTGSLFETAALTQSHWQAQTALLLGDVVFTDVVIADVLGPALGLRIFTNPRETYALTFSADTAEQVRAALWDQADIAAAGGQGSLRRMASVVHPSSWVLVDDLTDDVDTPEKYELILSRWGKLEAVP